MIIGLCFKEYTFRKGITKARTKARTKVKKDIKYIS
jgi:hypothetical protein